MNGLEGIEEKWDKRDEEGKHEEDGEGNGIKMKKWDQGEWEGMEKTNKGFEGIYFERMREWKSKVQRSRMIKNLNV